MATQLQIEQGKDWSRAEARGELHSLLLAHDILYVAAYRIWSILRRQGSSGRRSPGSKMAVCFSYYSVIMIYAFVIGAPGLFFSLDDWNGDRQLTRYIFSRYEIGTVTIYGLLFAPTVWLFYQMQPGLIERIMQDLCDRGVAIVPADSSGTVLLSEQLHLSADRRAVVRGKCVVFGSLSWMWPLILIAIALLTWPVTTPYRWRADIQWDDYWFGASAPFFAFWVLVTFSIIYPIVWIIYRQLAVIEMMRIIESEYEFQPKAYHEDGCNGFACVWRYTISRCLLEPC
mgnify:CR=1 FL=1